MCVCVCYFWNGSSIQSCVFACYNFTKLPFTVVKTTHCGSQANGFQFFRFASHSMRMCMHNLTWQTNDLAKFESKWTNTVEWTQGTWRTEEWAGGLSLKNGFRRGGNVCSRSVNNEIDGKYHRFVFFFLFQYAHSGMTSLIKLSLAPVSPLLLTRILCFWSKILFWCNLSNDFYPKNTFLFTIATYHSLKMLKPKLQLNVNTNWLAGLSIRPLKWLKLRMSHPLKLRQTDFRLTLSNPSTFCTGLSFVNRTQVITKLCTQIDSWILT